MYEYEIKGKLDKEFRKMAKRDRVLYDAVRGKMDQILDNPYLGKPLRRVLKGKRRVHIGHFVLIYEIDEKRHRVTFLGFTHHDEAYK